MEVFLKFFFVVNTLRHFSTYPERALARIFEPRTETGAHHLDRATTPHSCHGVFIN